MNHHSIKSAIADALNHATEFVVAFEALPARHRERDRSAVIDVTARDDEEPETQDEQEENNQGEIVGSFVATVPATDTASLDALATSLSGMGAPTIGRVRSAISIIGEFQDLYVAGDFSSLSMAAFRKHVLAYAENTRKALNGADAAFKAWLATLPDDEKQVGVKIGEVWYLTTAHVEALCHSKPGAGRKLIKDKALAIHKIGKRNHVLLEDFLKATQDDS